MENVYINDDNRNFYIVSLKQQSSSSVEKKEKKNIKIQFMKIDKMFTSSCEHLQSTKFAGCSITMNKKDIG